MSSVVVMPKLGDTMAFGVVAKWLKDNGSRVSKGEPLFEVETDKVTSVIEAPADGRLEQTVPEGAEVDVGETIAQLHPT
jgi:pyruvate/2-oxoglutarate dehydrogenase complex dihydrolipoamide acyltransferase (E2) component